MNLALLMNFLPENSMLDHCVDKQFQILNLIQDSMLNLVMMPKHLTKEESNLKSDVYPSDPQSIGGLKKGVVVKQGARCGIQTTETLVNICSAGIERVVNTCNP